MTKHRSSISNAEGGLSSLPGFPASPERISKSTSGKDVALRRTGSVRDQRQTYKLQVEQRQHRFHLLVQRYISQLIYGCENPLCTTPSCLSYQRRIAKAPIRRMTALSARTIASYLANQDDPEAGLCRNSPVVDIEVDGKPRRRRKSAPRKASHSRGTSEDNHSHDDVCRTDFRVDDISSEKENGKRMQDDNGSLKSESRSDSQASHSYQFASNPAESTETREKDPKSFTQNLFDTLAMRLLEWVPLKPSKDELDGSPCDQKESVSSGELRIGPHRRIYKVVEGNNNAVTAPKSRPMSQQEYPQVSRNEIECSSPEDRLESPVGVPEQDKQDQPNSGTGIFPLTGPHRPSLYLTTPSHAHRTVSPPTSPPVLRNRQEKHGRRPNGLVAQPDRKERRTVSWDGSKALKELETPTGDSETMRDHYVGIGGSFHSEQYANPIAPSTEEEAREKAAGPHLSFVETFMCFNSEEIATIQSMVNNAKNENEKTEAHWERTKEFKHLKRFPLGESRLSRVYDLLEQSIFYVFGFPEHMLRSFRPDESITTRDASPSQKGLDILYDTMHMFKEYSLSTNVVNSLWQGLEDLFIAHPSLTHRRPRSSTTKKATAVAAASSTQVGMSTHAYLSDTEATHIILIAFYALAALVPHMPLKQWTALREARARGRALPDKPRNEKWDHQGKDDDATAGDRTLDAYDALEDEMNLRMLNRLVRAISARLTVFEIMKLQSKDSRRSQAIGGQFSKIHVLDMVLERIKLDFDGSLHWVHNPNSKAECHRQLPLQIIEFVRSVLLKEWNGTPTATRGSPFGSAVLVLNSFWEHRLAFGIEDEVFYMPVLAEKLDILQMPVEWLTLTPDNDRVHLLDYSFLFSPADLNVYFRSMNFSTMTKAYEASVVSDRLVRQMRFTEHETQNPHDALRQRLRVATRPFLVLTVSRENPLQDTLDQLWKRERREFLRPLKVRLGGNEGEDGIDQGGVQQELFRLIMTEVLDPQFGMFTMDERTRMSWFQPASLEPASKFELIGLLFSLAIYNGLTLPVTFPIAFYRKLLGLKVKTIDHIRDGWPELGTGLESLLNWTDGDVGDVFMRTYDFSFEAFGETVNMDMTGGEDTKQPTQPPPSIKGKEKARSASPLADFEEDSRAKDFQDSVPPPQENTSGSDGWSEIAAPSIYSLPSHVSESPLQSQVSESPLVTNENRVQYVTDYINYLTSVSISHQFTSFQRGFYHCLDPRALSIFTPEALRAVVEGSQVVDIDALEKATKYEEGFGAATVGVDAIEDGNFGMDSSRDIERAYTKDSEVIKWFWEIVRSWDMEKKRKLLEFVTASDRVPVTGSGTIAFSIMRTGSDDKYLPTAATCFGKLLLPAYSSKKILKERLEIAVEHVWGFGVA